MTNPIIEMTGEIFTFIYSEEDFDLMILSEPIDSKQKGNMLRAIANQKKISYKGFNYILPDPEDAIIIKRGSNITHFGQSLYMVKDKNINLVDADDRKDENLDFDMRVKVKDILYCRSEINTTYIIARSSLRAGFSCVRTNINNLKL